MTTDRRHRAPETIRQQASKVAFGNPLVENSQRGLVAEIIVGSALGAEWRHCSGDWYGWDFQHTVCGTRLEVKQSAARQTWPRPAKAARPPAPRFDIRERSGYYAGAEWHEEVGRHAHLYVFAYHPFVDDMADHLDPSQWQFCVVPTAQLPPPPSKTIGLAGVRTLSGGAVSWEELSREVETQRQRLHAERSGADLRTESSEGLT